MLEKGLVCACFVAAAACGKGDGGDKPAGPPAPTAVPTPTPTAPAGPPRWDAPTLGGCLHQAHDSTCVMYIGASFANVGEGPCRAVQLSSPLHAGERCPDRFKLPGLCALAAGTDQETHVAYYDLQLTAEAAQKACADARGVWKP
jgi:hypothetical protein